MHQIIALAASVVPLLVAGTPAGTATYKDDHLQAALVSAQMALVPGQTALLGVYLQHAPHWHTYWINPGDSGLPTRLQWTLPPGYRTGDIQWPTPQRLTQGDIHDFGYIGDALLPVPLLVPADAKPGTTVHLQVEAKWLVCHERCIPGKAHLSLELPIRGETGQDPRTASLFEQARIRQPRDVAWKANAHLRGDTVAVSLAGAGIPADAKLDAFAQTTQVVANAPPHIERHGNRIDLRFAKNDYYASAPSRLTLVLTAAHGKQRSAYRVDLPFAAGDRPKP